jgi:hypothetical protein
MRLATRIVRLRPMTAVAEPAAALPPSDGSLPRGRRYAVWALLATATVLAVVAVFALWADRQALDADNLAETSGALLEDPAIQPQVAGFLVDSLYANVDVSGQLEQALPAPFKSLAGPVAGGLRNLALQSTESALARPRLQEAWRNANRVTAPQLIAMAEGKPGAVTASGDAVILDLRVLVPVLVMIAVVVAGVEALRRQTASEFPPGDDEHPSVVPT